MRWQECSTLDDVRVWADAHPCTLVGIAWKDLLLDMDLFGAVYDLQDFMDEAAEQDADGLILDMELDV